MLEAAETGRTISRSEMKDRRDTLRERLLEAQARLRRAPFSVIIVFGGVDGAGKGETANMLSEWLDPRHIRTRAYGELTPEERTLPEHWRYWRDLPAHGSMSVMLGGWHHRPFLGRVYGEIDAAEFDAHLDRINILERTLAADNTLILKFWMHLGKVQQEARFKALEADPLQSWRVSELDWDHWKHYDQFVEVAEHMLTRTSTDAAAWTVVEGLDANYRNLTVGEALLAALEARFSEQAAREAAVDALVAGDAERRAPKGQRVAPVIAS